MAAFRKLIYAILVLIVLVPLSFSARNFKSSYGIKLGSSSKRRGYSTGDLIPLFANKVFGADQRCEAYSYFWLPFCSPGEEVQVHGRKISLNEILAGDCLTNTQYELKFRISELDVILCKKYMSKDELERFRVAILNKFEYQMFFGNKWFGSKVGEAIEETGLDLGQKFYLFNHIEFKVDFMDNQVMDISIVNSLDSSVDITNITKTIVEFSYSVFWNEIKSINNSNKITAEKAMLLLEEDPVMVLSSIFLWTVFGFWWIALPLIIASPYLLWYFTVNSFKQPHEGVRRLDDKLCLCPSFTALLGAILGVGTQHLIIIALLFVAAYQGIYPCNLEKFSAGLVVSYCLTSVPCAFLARSFHENFSSSGWKECVCQTGALYFFPVFIAVLLGKMFVTNFLMVDHAVYILLKAGFGSAILMYLFCIATRQFYKRKHKAATCSTRRLMMFNRPSTLWYMKTPCQMIFVGLGTFLPIWHLMDSIYSSLWGLKVCGSFFTLFATFLVVIFTTIVSGISLTYIQLAKKDYDWWWRSVLRGGSPAVCMLVYGIYFLSKIKIESHMKLFPLLVYTVCLCYSFFLVLGTVGFTSSQLAYNYFMSRRI